MAYVFSHGYSIRSGFPHSDIGGSKLVCQLPAAFRRLPRPSSPVIAKASTTCTLSLDPITLSTALNPTLKSYLLLSQSPQATSSQRLVAHAPRLLSRGARNDAIIKPSRFDPDLIRIETLLLLPDF